MKHQTVESTLGCFIVHTPLHLACCSEISWHIKKTEKKKKILTYLLGVWNCSNIFIPVLFFLHADSPEDEEYHHTMYSAAFIVDCFKSARIHFLLNLSSFTQGHRRFCISILQLFKKRACLSLWLLTWPNMW